LLGPRFDHAFTSGIFLVAMALGLVAWAHPAALPGVLLVNLWLFAYPHVGSTYTRLVFDRASVREHWFLLFGLPPLVLGATAAVASWAGVAALTTGYFVWQTWHYTRQSYGIARAYRRARGAPAEGRDWPSDVVVFAFPAWGLLHRMSQAPTEFYWNPLRLPWVPGSVVVLAGVVATSALGVWAFQTWRDGRSLLTAEGRFLLSHVAITSVSYLVIGEITAGWLFINIWHNAQYLLFVYAWNARRYRRGVEPERYVVSWLSQPRRALGYAAACFAVGSGGYFLLGEATARLALASALPVVLIVHHAVNFHHYLADTVLWKGPRPARSPGLGSRRGIWYHRRHELPSPPRWSLADFHRGLRCCLRWRRSRSGRRQCRWVERWWQRRRERRGRLHALRRRVQPDFVPRQSARGRLGVHDGARGQAMHVRHPRAVRPRRHRVRVHQGRVGRGHPDDGGLRAPEGRRRRRWRRCRGGRGGRRRYVGWSGGYVRRRGRHRRKWLERGRQSGERHRRHGHERQRRHGHERHRRHGHERHRRHGYERHRR
jgi:hypothetical protein